MSETPETDAAISDGVEMLTNQSDSVALYQKLCDAVCEIQGLRRERDKWEETARLYCQNSDFHREMREKAERERDEARAELVAHREGHLCDSHRDMMGDCIVCSMEEKNERVLRG